jgi:hypothetical protein
MKKQHLFLLLIALLQISCEKDDVCPATTQTTPRIIIEFYDIAAPDEIKAVPGLFAIGLDTNANEVPIYNELVSTRSSIALPLQNNSSQTQFKLYESYNNVDSVISGNPDTITITYEIETVYVSRACGYINNFSIQTFSIASDNDQWMINSEILITTQVTNENEIHVKVLH